ncbi:tryptophan synthase subunit alpha [Micromonospora endophytica]|uniref:Tryptophan synthase alpha chain n=1 Tax=Micromonospora endophytica TaxID=515350 RepID=A0A2W2D4D7_9ACTN|nr:tryptophan synthase subunit alpha [Micromonospora endophytica]PZF95469.1 tryptophan synthase subunit alpha [Micromonospora endophytica]RIW51399.1 tryptophan synthase subunit alpha [Micromonospora endophytica]BCJ62099.1 tryptophan synthase alpha chain [Micromonospora endophytica]
MNALETRTRAARDAGRKLLLPYVTGGVTDDWGDLLRAAVDAGADAIEIGFPFSDPTLDGPVIQQSSDQALRRGATTRRILDEIARVAPPVPVIAFSYANLVLRPGADAYCAALADAGVGGLIVPDLPVDEMAPVAAAAQAHALDLALLAAPSTPLRRCADIARRSRGFVYAVSLMGTTGARSRPHESARELVRCLREETDLPVVLGFGIAAPGQAAEAAGYADGIAVGSALMRRLLDGATTAQLGAFLAQLRAALEPAG